MYVQYNKLYRIIILLVIVYTAVNWFVYRCYVVAWTFLFAVNLDICVATNVLYCPSPVGSCSIKCNLKL